MALDSGELADEREMAHEGWLEYALGKPRVLEGSRETDMMSLRTRVLG